MLTQSLETSAVQTSQTTAISTVNNSIKDNLATSSTTCASNNNNNNNTIYQQQQHYLQTLLAQQQFNNKYTINDQTMELDNQQYYQRKRMGSKELNDFLIDFHESNRQLALNKSLVSSTPVSSALNLSQKSTTSNKNILSISTASSSSSSANTSTSENDCTINNASPRLAKKLNNSKSIETIKQDIHSKYSPSSSTNHLSSNTFNKSKHKRSDLSMSTSSLASNTNKSLSAEVKLILRNKIFSKQEKLLNGNHHQKTNNNLINPALDDSNLRYTISEPALKVKSALLDKLRHRNNPLSRTQQTETHYHISNQSKFHHSPSHLATTQTFPAHKLSSSECIFNPLLIHQTEKENAVAFANSLAVAQEQFNHHLLKLNSPFFLHYQTNPSGTSQSQPYLNPIQWQIAMAALAARQQQQQLASLSLSSLPNETTTSANRRQASAYQTQSQFGNIAPFEEENEILLANKLKRETELNDSSSNSPNTFDLPQTNSSIYNQAYSFTNKVNCFSEPYLLRNQLNDSPHEIRHKFKHNLNLQNKISSYISEDQVMYKFTTGLIYDDRMLKHECLCKNPRNHIETPTRLEAIWNRFDSKGISNECELIETKLASLEDILLCHDEKYVQIYASNRKNLNSEYMRSYLENLCVAPCKGLTLVSDQDNTWNEEFTSIACRTAIGCTYELASLVYQGKLRNGFALVRPPGSHAERSNSIGFCYFNNVAVAAKMLKKYHKLERILIVDWDVHHGNGTQQLTYNDPNILYISLHRHDAGNFFPGTGSVHECGEGDGLGYNVNIAWDGKLNPPMGDADYLAAFRCLVMPIARAYKPQIVLVSCGFDATEAHPKELGGYKITPMCFAYMTKKLMSLAEGKLLLVLEGGYDLPSLCDSAEMCANALLNKQIPSFSNATLDALPNKPAIKTLEETIDVHEKYWPCLKDSKSFINMSQNQFIQRDTD